jgi:hypothetical protein
MVIRTQCPDGKGVAVFFGGYIQGGETQIARVFHQPEPDFRTMNDVVGLAMARKKERSYRISGIVSGAELNKMAVASVDRPCREIGRCDGNDQFGEPGGATTVRLGALEDLVIANR